MELTPMLLLVVFLEILLVLISVIISAAFAIEGVLILTSKRLGSPFVPTQRKFFYPIAQSLYLKAGATLFELGSGAGGFLLSCAKEWPDVTCVGIERNLLLLAYSHLRKRIAGNPKNASFILGNFFKADLGKATHIYAYLLPEVMDMLLPKFERGSKKLCVASLAFPISKKQPTKVIELSKKRGLRNQHILYLYEF